MSLKLEQKKRVGTAEPRGPLMDAELIVKEFLTLPDGRSLRTARWVKEHLPHKVRLGHRTIAWYRDDVILYLELLRAA